MGRGSLTLTALPSHAITIRKSGHKQNIPNLDERFKMIVSRRARLPITSLEIDSRESRWKAAKQTRLQSDLLEM